MISLFDKKWLFCQNDFTKRDMNGTGLEYLDWSISLFKKHLTLLVGKLPGRRCLQIEKQRLAVPQEALWKNQHILLAAKRRRMRRRLAPCSCSLGRSRTVLVIVIGLVQVSYPWPVKSHFIGLKLHISNFQLPTCHPEVSRGLSNQPAERFKRADGWQLKAESCFFLTRVLIFG